MMKKLLPLSAAVAGVMISSQGFAATAQGTFSATQELAPIASTDIMACPALDNNITVQLSKNVIAGYSCNDGNFIAATCHTAGLNKNQTVQCSWKEDTTTTDPTDYIVNAEGCAATPPNPMPDPAPTGTISGRVGFQGTSAGGQVGVADLKATICDTTTILNLAPAYSQ